MKNLKHQNCQERIQLAKQTTLLLTTTSQLFTLTDTTLSFFDVLGIGQHKELNLGHDSLVGSVNACSIIDTVIEPKFAAVFVFLFFHLC